MSLKLDNAAHLTLKEMTPEMRSMLMEAFMQDKEVQVLSGSEWRAKIFSAEKMAFFKNHIYRIKPEPVVETWRKAIGGATYPRCTVDIRAVDGNVVQVELVK